jgi:hypothetical protein
MIPKDIQCSIRGTKKCNEVIFDNINNIEKRARCSLSLNEIAGGDHGASINKLLWDIRNMLLHVEEARKNSFKHAKAMEQSLESAWATVDEAQIHHLIGK